MEKKEIKISLGTVICICIIVILLIVIVAMYCNMKNTNYKEITNKQEEIREKEKEVKTNAMRILEKLKIPFEVKTYECDEFVDGMHIADQLGQPYAQSFKTLVMQGKSKEYYVFVLPVDKEVDLKKAAHVVGEKSLAMVHVKDIQAVTGYIRGGCTSIGMKKKYRTVIHESAREWDTVIVSGGRLGSQILLSPDDLVKAVDGEMADIVFCENK